MKQFLILVFILLPLPILNGQVTINVPGDYSTVQAGINAASNGDVVLVADGTYYENINFRGKAITVASHFLLDGNRMHIENTIINGSTPVHPDSGSHVRLFRREASDRRRQEWRREDHRAIRDVEDRIGSDECDLPDANRSL